MISKFATSGVTPTERLRYWNSIADEAFCGTFVNADSQKFQGEMWCWQIGDLSMIRTRSIDARVGRKALDGPQERAIMHMQWRGRGVHRQGDREARLEPGDFVIGSPHAPYGFDLTAHEMMVIEFPKHELRDRVPDLDARFATRLSGASPAGRMFSDFLLSLWRLAEDRPTDTDWATGISGVIYDLAAMAIRDVPSKTPERRSLDGLRQRALALVETALTDPDLRTASLADELGTSVRTVQKVFADMGTTPSAAILDRRLHRAADQLIADPTSTITEVAFAHGFNDSAYFTRCFRQKFGVAPREWRLRVRLS